MVSLALICILPVAAIPTLPFIGLTLLKILMSLVMCFVVLESTTHINSLWVHFLLLAVDFDHSSL